MNKLAAYELLLEDHPLWTKEAGADARAYKLIKPHVLKAMNAQRRTGSAAQKEAIEARNALQRINKNVGGAGKSIGGPDGTGRVSKPMRAVFGRMINDAVGKWKKKGPTLGR